MTPSALGYGVHLLGLRLEWPRFAFLAVPRINRGDRVRGGEEVVNFNVSVGGRYLFSAQPTSAYVGGGVSPGLWSNDDPAGQDRTMKGSGLGAYAEAGVEVFRSSYYQMSFGLHVDAPFYGVRNAETGNRVFPVPVSLDVTISTAWPTFFVR